MLRRSARHKVEENSNNNSPHVDIPKTQTTRKRIKKAQAAEPVDEPSETKPKRKRGKLRFITEVPLDVLFEIFGQLLPADILNVSRASKVLRDMLLRKSSAFLWKQTFLNVPSPAPPPRPDDMNEAQYANLLWSKYCFVIINPDYSICTEILGQFCGVSTPLVFWACRVRACHDCIHLPARITSLNHGWYSDQPANSLELAKTLVPRSWHSPSRRGGGFLGVTRDLEAIQRRLDELAETNSDTQLFVQQCQDTKNARSRHAALCERWQKTLKHNRQQELRNAGEGRKKAILAKMGELGWTDELSDYRTEKAFLALPAVRQNKELTNRVWANIEPELVAFLTEIRKQRLDQERVDVLRRRASILTSAAAIDLFAIPLSDVRPYNSDLCVMPEYRAVLERPSNVEVT
ncbi:hypothetical protein B0H14DRAFT_26305, partial [Mycena olivaceomarginata]